MPFGKPKEPKAQKEKKPKKPKPPKKEKPPKKPKPPKKVRPPKKPKKGQPPPQEGEEGLEGQVQEEKKKKPIILLLIPIVVVAAAAVALFLFILPHRDAPDDPATVETEEPKPPELPEELKVGEESVPGMTLEADESGALAELAKTITYTYTNLNDAGKAAETYVGQLRSADPGFSVVDEEFVRLRELPDFTAAEGTVLLARNLPKPEPEGGESPAPTDPPEEGSGAPEESQPAQSPEPEASAPPEDETPDKVLTVRITWSKAEGKCVVTADEAEGKVTSPPQEGRPGVGPSIGFRDAEAQILSMTPAELGLPGTSMSDYEVFPQGSTELVNGVSCIRVDVYNSSSGPRPYEFEGSYLMSVDGAHLYRLNPVTNELQELDFTLNG